MEKKYFDYDISEESLKQMGDCFNPSIKNYPVGDTILTYSDKLEKVGILTSGEAKLYLLDDNGETSLLETYVAGDIFGEPFSLPLENYEYLVISSMASTVMFIDYNHIITPCEKVCAHHSQLINNLFVMTAQKSQSLSLHISILNQHTIRKKLLAYLKHIQNIENSNPFTIPMSLSSLSEYISVDRAAMMREIGLMKKDGLIASDRRKFTIFKSKQISR